MKKWIMSSCMGAVLAFQVDREHFRFQDCG